MYPEVEICGIPGPKIRTWGTRLFVWIQAWKTRRRRVRFVISHPFRKGREMDEARKFQDGPEVEICGIPGPKIRISTPQTKTCPWGPRPGDPAPGRASAVLVGLCPELNGSRIVFPTHNPIVLEINFRSAILEFVVRECRGSSLNHQHNIFPGANRKRAQSCVD